MPNPTLSIEAVLGPNGLVARALQGYEFRPSQMQMALLIEEALQKKIPVTVEAGTGTGKTFGYLLPLILSGKKAVVSTGTKNLQEQVYFKDLPLLRRATGLDIDAVIMKGRGNYLCLHRYHQFFSQSSILKTKQEKLRHRLEKWLKKTEFADRSELNWLADDDTLWDALSSSSEQCLGANCAFLDDCFLGRLRSRAAESAIIIVNHHLFFADLKVKEGGFGEIIPRFQVVVFDEAHNIEAIATAYLGESLSTNQLTELAGNLEKEIKGFRGPDIDKGQIKKQLNAIKAASEHLRVLFNDRGEKDRLDPEALSVIREGPGAEILRGLTYLQAKSGLKDPDNFALQGLSSKACDLAGLLERILRPRDTNWLNWYERRKKSLVLHASPLDIAERMREQLYKKVKTVVFTSATISTNGNFDYIRSRLGLPENCLQGIYPSHFDFKNQTLMYIPKDLPVPNDPDFGPAIAKRIADILETTQGRAMVLFTSYHNLNLVYRCLKGRMPYTLSRQGDAPRSALLDAFRQDIHSVLLATGSFWQGVDVPGEALSCLIIDKLPFDSPGEPLVAARIEAIRERGDNPFMAYQVPSAIISLKQGLGRLIRKGSDKGILSVLDIRIRTSRYGKTFLDSLPEIPVTQDLTDIREFFKR